MAAEDTAPATTAQPYLFFFAGVRPRPAPGLSHRRLRAWPLVRTTPAALQRGHGGTRLAPDPRRMAADQPRSRLVNAASRAVGKTKARRLPSALRISQSEEFQRGGAMKPTFSTICRPS